MIGDPIRARMARSGNWFYWIAILSLINAISAAAGQNFTFVVGSGFVEAAPSFGQPAATIIDAAVVGFFAILGYFAVRGHLWAFIIGMLVYLIDGALFLIVQDWIGVAFHALVLYWLFLGLRACIDIRALEGQRRLVMPHVSTGPGAEPPGAP